MPTPVKLSDYPVKFGEEGTDTIDFLSSWEETTNVVEDVQTSAWGLDIIIVVRQDKLSVSAGGRVSSNNLKLLQQYSQLMHFALWRWDAVLENYDVRSVRMRNFTKSKVRYSDDLTVTMGVWDVSFTLEEI